MMPCPSFRLFLSNGMDVGTERAGRMDSVGGGLFSHAFSGLRFRPVQPISR